MDTLGSLELKVRGYEIDRWKRVPLSNLLRFTEHARWEFAIRDNSRIKRLFSDQGFLVVRSQYGSLLNSATLGDRLRIDLRISHVGGSSLTFEQRVTQCDAEDTLIARVFVVTVYVGSDKRPKRLPNWFRDEHRELDAPTRLEKLEDPAAGLNGFELQIRNSDIDLLQHVNHARYVDFLQDARAERALMGSLRGPGSHPEVAPTAFSIEYLREVKPHERLVGYAWNGASDNDVFVAGLVPGEDRPRFRGCLEFAPTEKPSGQSDP